jgi:hypothetical protein
MRLRRMLVALAVLSGCAEKKNLNYSVEQPDLDLAYELADADADGDLDLVPQHAAIWLDDAGEPAGLSFALFRNDSGRLVLERHDGHRFSRSTTGSLAFGDLDGDEDLDVVTQTAHDLLISYRDGLEYSAPRQTTVPPSWAVETELILAIFDIDGDQIPNLLTRHAEGRIMSYQLDGEEWRLVNSIRVGRSTCLFDGTVHAPNTGARIRDVDGDGALDLLTMACREDDPIIERSPVLTLLDTKAWRGRLPSVPFASGSGTVAVGDVSGDDIPDLVAAMRGHLLIYAQDPSNRGHFTATIELRAGTESEAQFPSADLLIADVDGDGRNDILTREHVFFARAEPMSVSSWEWASLPAAPIVAADFDKSGRAEIMKMLRVNDQTILQVLELDLDEQILEPAQISSAGNIGAIDARTAIMDAPAGNTLQFTIDTARDGMTIRVPPGDYEGIILESRALRLVGASGDEGWSTVRGNSRPAVLVADGSDIILENLRITVTGDIRYGYAVDVHDSSPFDRATNVVVRAELRNNLITGVPSGGAVRIIGKNNFVILSGNAIVDNGDLGGSSTTYPPSSAGGILVAGGGFVRIENNLIARNNMHDGPGGLNIHPTRPEPSTIEIVNNTIYGNRSNTTAGGALLSGQLVAANNLIDGNLMRDEPSDLESSTDNVVVGTIVANLVGARPITRLPEGNIVGPSLLEDPLNMLFAPGMGSPAIDAAAPEWAPELDMLAKPRSGQGPDIGAFERP